MLRNYITITLRNIGRNITYTIINISGLSLGIACSTVLFLLILFLTSFDTDHPEGDRIYRVVTSSLQNDRENFFPGVPAPLPEAVKNDLAGIESVLFISGTNGGQITIEENGAKHFFEEEQGIAYTDSLYFTFFNHPLVAGSFSHNKPGEAVISQKLARKYFGNVDVLGKIIRLNNERDLRISGVMADYPDNTSFPFDLLIAFETIRKSKIDEGWGSVYSGDQCYVMLKKGYDAADVNKQFGEFIRKNQGEEAAQHMKRWLQPLNEIHYDTRFNNYAQRTISKESIWAMGIVAIFLVVTACINFVNLSTAVAVKRSKEVGVRKVMGSQRIQLVIQFLSETFLITLFGLLLAVGISELALIQLNSFLELDLHVNFQNGKLLMFLGALWFFVSAASGMYPAILLSRFSPVTVLKNKMSNKNSGGYVLRRGLVVFQFMISQFLIVGTIILLTQMNYFNSKDLGFAKEAIVTVLIPDGVKAETKKTFKNEVDRLPGVEKTSLCYTPPTSGYRSDTDFQLEGQEGMHMTQVKMADDSYFDLFEMKLVAGRELSASDTASGYVVNEKLVQVAGIDNPQDIIGRNIKVWGKALPVVGVVRDFHTVSLAHEIDPTVLMCDLPGYRTLAFKVKPGETNATIENVEKIWSSLYGDYIFNYQFLDADIASFYEDTQKMSVLLLLFSCIAIVIGCLGLYGLISFMANQKEKEIGVRKVLGATTGQIMTIFSKEFIVLIVIAFVLASPLAGYVMNKWLENFAYHISLQWTMFFAGIAVTLIIAFMAVGYRSLRAARTNPVNVLRSE